MNNKDFNKQFKKTRKFTEINEPKDLVGNRLIAIDMDEKQMSGDDIIDLMEELWGPCEDWEEDEE